MGAEEAAGVSDEVTEETLSEIHRCEQNDAYKLFYGTWEITQIISEHRRDGRGEQDSWVYFILGNRKRRIRKNQQRPPNITGLRRR